MSAGLLLVVSDGRLWCAHDGRLAGRVDLGRVLFSAIIFELPVDRFGHDVSPGGFKCIGRNGLADVLCGRAAKGIDHARASAARPAPRFEPLNVAANGVTKSRAQRPGRGLHTRKLPA